MGTREEHAYFKHIICEGGSQVPLRIPLPESERTDGFEYDLRAEYDDDCPFCRHRMPHKWDVHDQFVLAMRRYRRCYGGNHP